MTIQKFVAQYGTKGPSLWVNALIRKTPDVPGDEEFMKGINEMLTDLQSALESTLDQN